MEAIQSFASILTRTPTSNPVSPTQHLRPKRYITPVILGSLLRFPFPPGVKVLTFHPTAGQRRGSTLRVRSRCHSDLSDDEKDLMKHAGPCLAQDTGSTMRCEIIGACRYYLETSSERQAKAGRFPTLTNLIQPSNQFHSPPFPRYSD